MSRYPGYRALLDSMDSRAREQSNADAVGRKSKPVKTARQMAAEAKGVAESANRAVVRDDGVAPAAPSGVVVVPTVPHQVDLTWDDPPESDYVASSVIEVTPSGESMRTYKGAAGYGYVSGLANKQHTFRVRLVDRWGRRSAQSVAKTATPELTAAEYINFKEVEIAEQLGWENLENLNDPSKIGSNIITGRMMAVHTAAMIDAWIENAAIRNAKIANLSVDKLTAGAFTAGQIVLAGGGAIMAGRVRLDSSGITLPPIDAFNAPVADRDYKISSGGDFAAISFFRDTGSAGLIQGIGLRVDGNQFRAGAVSIRATDTGNVNSGNTGTLDIYSSSPGGTIATNSQLYVYNRVYMGPRIGIIQNGTTNTAGILEFLPNGKLMFGGREIAFV